MDQTISELPSLVLLQGGDALASLDMTHLLEEMDLRDALPLLQQLGRRMKPAANSPLSLVGSDLEDAQRPR